MVAFLSELRSGVGCTSVPPTEPKSPPEGSDLVGEEWSVFVIAGDNHLVSCLEEGDENVALEAHTVQGNCEIRARADARLGEADAAALTLQCSSTYCLTR